METGLYLPTCKISSS